ncbi:MULTISPECIES: MDR family MFS transporter [unclassified Leucobacter]|uniref:MDR family MFS transporter n=1 Tax=unclassified Leucobacter TaxID=2621730 RepID=UPI00165DA004|nr:MULTISPECIES: MDR family MFS transporter [unclassified Leucobacter]MBC9926509.1 multidrug efflux MFS transporter [Leucobacter sp. cx-169]MBC9937110.1 multidrug efflux MFS transporter [Leucobacter sp. cx-87]
MSRSSAVHSSEHAVDDKIGPRENLAIWLLLVSSFVVILNETVMGVALPRLMLDLDISPSTGQWLTTAFLLTMSVVIPITGMLIQRMKTRTLFIVAMAFFVTGTAVAAIAPGFAVLLLGRIVQAVGTAIMMPLLMTTVITLVPERHRGALMGRIAIVMSVAPALGPTLSGMILQHLSWRWLFIVMLPIAAAALVIGAIKLPNVGERRYTRIDAISVVLSALGFGGIVFGLSAVGQRASGGEAVEPLIPIIVGVISLGLFVWRQLSLQRHDRALLDLRTFNSRPFALSVLLLAVSMIALFGTLVLLPIYLQDVLGADTLATGLVLLPGGLLMGLLGPVVGGIVDRHGVKPLLVPGTAMTAAALWLMGTFGEFTPIWLAVVAHLILSIGLACTFTPLFSLSLGSLPPHLAAHGSATISTIQQVAGAAGTAVFVTVMSVVSAGAISRGIGEVPAMANGMQAAFLLGGAVATLAAVVAIFVKADPIVHEETVEGVVEPASVEAQAQAQAQAGA